VYCQICAIIIIIIIINTALGISMKTERRETGFGPIYQ